MVGLTYVSDDVGWVSTRVVTTMIHGVEFGWVNRYWFYKLEFIYPTYSLQCIYLVVVCF
ncbi:uncharacterized protein BDW43DRAFT_258457 [Aspergillus alliaceus]|uniref:uncharacterized protein n=1 Tax=Petromyces alliaceus TaxID=209559 RepID=UPI0012A6FC7B|nr:uncharacterized protein BDW43DRAFT_258457 [Aspergillus alliaceus]KAB8239542.1 hypothetical protein BDW43DRAFT_258457 [Aspergillus alliaceus]